MQVGTVSLVGAGPGQLRLMTLAALDSIRAANVVLYDALLSKDIVELIPPQCIRRYVGKRCGRHSLNQSEINHLMLMYARLGKRVVRLKGGDPFLFGRGGEELLFLHEHGISVEVIPGVSAFNGLAAEELLPLTLRGGSDELRLIQGHSMNHNADYWHELARYQGSLGIYMAMNHVHEIMQRLIQYGAISSREVMIVESDEVTGARQVTTTTIKALSTTPYLRKSSGPGFIYISDNISLRPSGIERRTQVEMEEASYENSLALVY